MIVAADASPATVTVWVRATGTMPVNAGQRQLGNRFIAKIVAVALGLLHIDHDRTT